MFSKRFFISWIASSVGMFAAFYMWHGMFLTDFMNLAYPKEVFLVVSSFVYLIVGLVLNKAYEMKPLSRFNRKPILRGMVAGTMLGVVLFMVTMVMGVSFSGTRTMADLLLDISWQVVEQALGGAIVGLVHIFVFDERSFLAEQESDQ
jgi:hypothetical protein